MDAPSKRSFRCDAMQTTLPCSNIWNITSFIAPAFLFKEIYAWNRIWQGKLWLRWFNELVSLKCQSWYKIQLFLVFSFLTSPPSLNGTYQPTLALSRRKRQRPCVAFPNTNFCITYLYFVQIIALAWDITKVIILYGFHPYSSIRSITLFISSPTPI